MRTPNVKKIIELALAEDIGPGDVTTDAIVDDAVLGRAVIIAKEPLLVAGVPVAAQVFQTVNPDVVFHTVLQDGEHAVPGDTVAEISGPVADLLRAERVALNFLQHLSGIASLTEKFVQAVAGLPVKIVDTRKTTPGLRVLEKYAVRVGGGHNHRFALYDGILIKDNHWRACSSLTEAVRSAGDYAPHLMKIEVEVGTIGELREALEAGVETILLDNMDVSTLREAVSVAGGKAILEASGGVNLQTVRDIAETGVHLISVGALTHSARACDLSMRLVETEPR